LNKKDIKIGMKVVPFQKTVKNYLDFNSSGVWRRAKEKNQNYLYVVGFEENEKYYMLSEIMGFEIYGDFYNAEDFEPYTNGKINKETDLKEKVNLGSIKPKMSDKEFIVYLCEQIWNIASDGDEPDIDKITIELKNRGIDSNDIFILL
jgi:hypothetical protein